MIASRSMIVLLLAILLMAILTGSSCAAFLWLLDVVTDLRHKHEWLVFFLPIAGLVSGWMYSKWGDRVEGGNNLVLDEIHRPTSGVPIRIAPMVLLGTLITHLFGGAAGREGTAVQMAAGISEFCRRWFGISDPGRQSLLLQTSVAAGFSGVFGTPIAGALFALEVVRRQAIHTTSLPVCLAAAVISDRICLAWGATHTHYTIRPELFANAAGDSATVAPSILNLILYAAVFGVAFGAAAVLFCRATHHISDLSKRYIRNPSFRPAIGGLCVLTAYLLFGGADYLGLGVERPSQPRFHRELLQDHGAKPYSWLSKLVLTSMTVGSGFKGGEVTPLFFVGAALGNTIASVFSMPPDLFAGLGFVCLFAAATKTPVSSLIMSVELFGSEYLVCFAVAISVAVFVSGEWSIYKQRREHPPAECNAL